MTDRGCRYVPGGGRCYLPGGCGRRYLLGRHHVAGGVRGRWDQPAGTDPHNTQVVPGDHHK